MFIFQPKLGGSQDGSRRLGSARTLIAEYLIFTDLVDIFVCRCIKMEISTEGFADEM